MTDYGQEVSTFPDLDVTFRWLPGTSVRGPLERVARSWLTRIGTLPHALGRGVDVTRWLHQGMSETDRAQLQQDLNAEALRCDGVEDVQVSVVVSMSARTLTVSGWVDLGEGPIATALTVDAVGTYLLDVRGSE